MAGYSEEWVDVQKITFTRVRFTAQIQELFLGGNGELRCERVFVANAVVVVVV